MSQHVPTRRRIGSRGFSLVELTVCTVILLITALAAAPAIMGAQQNWKSANESVLSSLVRDGRKARTAFQTAARRAIRQSVTFGSGARSVDLPYYASPDSTRVDRYATLTWSNSSKRLTLSEGLVNPDGTRQTLSDTVVCEDVSTGVFTRSGKCVRMRLVFTNGTRQLTIVAAALMNN